MIDLKNIKYNKVNNILSILKVCASLDCPGGICPCRGYMSQGVGVLGDKCPGGK